MCTFICLKIPEKSLESQSASDEEMVGTFILTTLATFPLSCVAKEIIHRNIFHWDGTGWNRFFINLWLICIRGREQISSPPTDILSTYFLCLPKSLEFLNQILKLWSQVQKKHFYTPFLKIRNICAFTNRDFSLLHTNHEFFDIFWYGGGVFATLSNI